MFEALVAAEKYLVDRGIETKGVVGRTQLLPQIRAAIASGLNGDSSTPAVVAPAEDGFDGWYATHKPGPAADSPYHWRVSHSARKSEDRAVWNAAIAHAQRSSVVEAIEAAAFEIESGHAWITAIGASAILRKHAAAIREQGG